MIGDGDTRGIFSELHDAGTPGSGRYRGSPRAGSLTPLPVSARTQTAHPPPPPHTAVLLMPVVFQHVLKTHAFCVLVFGRTCPKAWNFVVSTRIYVNRVHCIVSQTKDTSLSTRRLFGQSRAVPPPSFAFRGSLAIHKAWNWARTPESHTFSRPPSGGCLRGSSSTPAGRASTSRKEPPSSSRRRCRSNTPGSYRLKFCGLPSRFTRTRETKGW